MSLTPYLSYERGNLTFVTFLEHDSYYYAVLSRVSSRLTAYNLITKCLTHLACTRTSGSSLMYLTENYKKYPAITSEADTEVPGMSGVRLSLWGTNYKSIFNNLRRSDNRHESGVHKPPWTSRIKSSSDLLQHRGLDCLYQSRYGKVPTLRYSEIR